MPKGDEYLEKLARLTKSTRIPIRKQRIERMAELTLEDPNDPDEKELYELFKQILRPINKEDQQDPPRCIHLYKSYPDFLRGYTPPHDPREFYDPVGTVIRVILDGTAPSPTDIWPRRADATEQEEYESRHRFAHPRDFGGASQETDRYILAR